MKKIIYLLILLDVICINVTKAQLSFTQIKSEYSGIDFKNIINESDSLNEFTFYYMLNGGGVAIGDINNDGLSDIYFISNMQSNKLYLNLGNLKFKDITDSAKVNGGDGFKTGVTMVDINADGFLDIYVCKSAYAGSKFRKNVLYINNGNNTFTEKASEFGLDDASYSTQSFFYDMDLDGDLDMFLLNHPIDMKSANNIPLSYDKDGNLFAKQDTLRTFVSNRYYENINGHFTDKTFSAGLGTYAFGLSSIIDDFNGDGFPDIYICNDVKEPDYLFINNKNKTFTNKASDYFKHFSYSSMGSDYADINNDGALDLVALDMLPESLGRLKELIGPPKYDNFYTKVKYGLGYQYVKNVLQLNNGNNTYSDISYLSGIASTEWSWTPLLADFDNDGLKDLYITNGYLRDITNMDFMMYEGDSIRKEVMKARKTDEALKILSVIPSYKMQNYFYKNNGNLTFSNITKDCGMTVPSWSNGAVYADLDNDGDLDIIVNNLMEEPFLYRNNTSENKSGNFIRFKLIGPKENPFGIGVSIRLDTPDGKKQVQHFMPDKGYLSCNEWFVHFGIGGNQSANAVITWPNGYTENVMGIGANNYYPADIKNATSTLNNDTLKTTPLFIDITKQTNVSYISKENTYIDFKQEPLLPHEFSKMGPTIAVADINNDGLDDFYVGGSKDHEGTIFIQDLLGQFKIKNEQELIADKEFEDLGSEFFDADNDGDKDLIVVSGGNEYPDDSIKYPVRLYMNDGNGNFKKNSSFPNIYTSAKAIAIDDYDKDGDQDVFIGGRVVPGRYGLMPNSYLMKNNKGYFSEVANISLKNIGMVTGAIWCDVDGDSWKDLVLVGEWMPLTIFKNKNGVLDSLPTITSNSYGWWNTIQQADLDGDGDMDLIAGNISFNTKYKANEQFPLTMIVSDFDNNGSTDCIISAYQDGISYPIAMRDVLLDQIPTLKKKFLRYKDYSSATINTIFSSEQLKKATTLKMNDIANTVFTNDGYGNFTQQYLPVKSQIFPINAVITEDVNKDGIVDLLVAGNDYSTEVETGRKDGGIGLYLSGIGKNKFKATPVTESGFYVPGDVKCMKKIVIKNKSCVIVGKNSDAIQILQLNN